MTAGGLVTINGVLYRVPSTWKPGDGVPILERVMPDDAPTTTQPSSGNSWVWLVGAGLLFFMLAGGKGRR